jgi:hypothetical protein
MSAEIIPLMTLRQRQFEANLAEYRAAIDFRPDEKAARGQGPLVEHFAELIPFPVRHPTEPTQAEAGRLDIVASIRALTADLRANRLRAGLKVIVSKPNIGDWPDDPEGAA